MKVLMVRRRFFSAVSNHGAQLHSLPILRDARKGALLRMRMRQVFDSAFFDAKVALRLSSSSTFTPLRRMMKLCCSTDSVLFQAQ